MLKLQTSNNQHMAHQSNHENHASYRHCFQMAYLDLIVISPGHKQRLLVMKTDSTNWPCTQM